MKLKPLVTQISTTVVLSSSLASTAIAVDLPTAGQIQDNLRTKQNVFKKKQTATTQNNAPKKKQTVKAGGKKIKVNKFIIEGNTLFSSEELSQQIASHEGTSMTLKEVYAVADKLTKFYRDAGYSLATAAVPAQKVSGGTIKLQVSEGIVDKLVFKGNTKYTDEFLAHQLDEIAPGKAIKLDSLEREVLLLDGLPGLTARSLIKPGEDQGTASVEFNTEEDPFEGLILMDNAGSDAIGVYRWTVNGTSNNHFGIGDALTVGHTHTEHDLLKNWQLGYNFPIFQDGTRVGIDYSAANFVLGHDFKDLDIDGASTNLKVSITHPFIRSRKDNLQASAAIISQTSETRQAGVKVGAFDPNLTFLELSMVASRVHEDQSFTNMTVKFSHNGHRNRDGLNNNSLYGRFDLDISHERAIFPNWSLFGRFVGVASIDPQMDLTQFGIGGPGSIRGFPTSEARGDYGYFGQIEARRFVSWSDDITGGFKVFLDHGSIYRKVVPDGFNDSETLTSYGLGANVTFKNEYNLDLIWAYPYRHNGRSNTEVPLVSDKKKDGRIWVTFSKSI